jgi:hypothetical protein
MRLISNLPFGIIQIAIKSPILNITFRDITQANSVIDVQGILYLPFQRI